MTIKGLNNRILDLCSRLDNDMFLSKELRERYLTELAQLIEQRDRYYEILEEKTNKE